MATLTRCHFETISLQNQGSLTIFGFELPFLPDFLADHTLLGETPAERIEELLSRWVQFVGWLWKWRDTAFSLRFWSSPAEGRITIAFLGRYTSPVDQAGKSEQIASDILNLLNVFGLPHKPLDAPTLQSFLGPFNNPFIAEVRQHEELMQFPLLQNQTGYVVHPYRAPQGSFLLPFETLLRQPAPALVNLYLEPTQLYPREQQALATAAAKAETFKEHQVTGDFLPSQMQGGIRMADPQMALAARLHADILKRLSEPFIGFSQVASPDAVTAITVARAISRSVTHGQLPTSGGEPLPSSADVVFAEDAPSVQAARWSLERMSFCPWGQTLAIQSPGLERLRFLNDAAGVAVNWRLPINVRGGIPGIEVRQSAPDFEPGPRPLQPAAHEITLGNLRRGGVMAASLHDLTRHTLITGFTGSGKTNTVLYLLDQLWRRHKIPFLVIESAKKEYRALKQQPGFEDLLVFTLGDDSTSPFRLNPFELIPGVRVESHVGKLQACFDAALPQFGILPSVIAEALEEIYREKGWRLNDQVNESPQSTGASWYANQTPLPTRLFPTMRDLYNKVIRVVEERGYGGEMRDNIRAAAAGRIANLLRGSRGRMFGGQRSFPPDIIFKRPVILELNDLNEDDKSLIMMFLLTWLREYREQHPAPKLQHVTVVEEAHNVMSNVSSVGNPEVSADTKAKAVAAFANMLSEVRAYGEGIMISDQSPEKLAPDAMRNTNLQIAHQLRDRHDREAIARAMIMDEEQQNYLGKLRVGEAALFRANMEKATFITVPSYKGHAFDNAPDDAEIRQWMEPFQKQHRSSALPFDGCKFCTSPCAYREAIEWQTLNKKFTHQLRQALSRFEAHPESHHWSAHWREIASVCHEVARAAHHPKTLDAAYCYLVHEVDFPFTEHMRIEFAKGFNNLDKS